MKARFSLSVVVAALGVAAGSGGAWAVNAHELQDHGQRIGVLENEQKSNRDRLTRIETILEEMSRTVERIDRKLDR